VSDSDSTFFDGTCSDNSIDVPSTAQRDLSHAEERFPIRHGTGPAGWLTTGSVEETSASFKSM
jgi:hypothetical protein